MEAESLWALPLVEALPVGIASVDLSGFILHCNEAFARIAGSDDTDALRGRPLAGLFVRADRDDLTRQLSKLVMGAAKCVRLDGLGADRSGLPSIVSGTGPLALVAFPLIERGDVNSIGVCVVAEIERVVDGAALAQRQKMQAVGQLAGGIAHDFNNLLTAMLGFCDLLLTRHQAGDPSHDEIQQVRDNAIRAAGLVRQLLAFSRKQTLSPVHLSVETALANLSAMLPRLLGPAIEFRLNVAADVGDIEVDPNQFDQIIINLAVNAKDAMPGGGTLTIRTRQSRRSDHTDCAGEVIPAADYVCIDVSDTGVGIPKEIIGHIFEPFLPPRTSARGPASASPPSSASSARWAASFSSTVHSAKARHLR
ncbi:PAS domain-containing protein [Defluviicoccus vanus]|uniref:histidine kinase n=1 Tax=Defluviicoccus vanus TaxID=111831 RepID=A0A7H1MXD6_9PROT|nr:PAS domain-containing sensor histidine kinase [Defluviicoccus vanus]QNT68122.1 PAS domain-containing protein [Defluviicoccus vanus]